MFLRVCYSSRGAKKRRSKMARKAFYEVLEAELERVDEAKTSKRQETVIEEFTDELSPKAVIEGEKYRIFNSNDYLGLRFDPELKKAEEEAVAKYGTGPGAVRFISGSMKVHRDLERKLAEFHGREAGMVVSSAFATNLAVLFSLITGQSRDSKVGDDVLVVSDSLNHRSIIDGIRLANHPKEKRKIFKHMDMDDLSRVLAEGVGKHERALVVTDGVFSMLGEYQNLGQMRQVVDEYDEKYEKGVLLVVDDAHGVGAFGKTGKGTEEVAGGMADVLVGTLGKAFGADGGYVVANETVIDYFREAGATYIYSNNISPGTAAASLAAVSKVESKGEELMKDLRGKVEYFKKKMRELGYEFAADSIHPIQPILIGEPGKARELRDELYRRGILVTTISYPVVPKGDDEIRVQISGAHTREDLDYFVEQAKKVKEKVGL